MGKRRKNLRREQLRSAAQKQKSTLDVLVPKPVAAAPTVAPAPAPAPAPAVASPSLPKVVHAADLASTVSPKIAKAKPIIKSVAAKRTAAAKRNVGRKGATNKK